MTWAQAIERACEKAWAHGCKYFVFGVPRHSGWEYALVRASMRNDKNRSV